MQHIEALVNKDIWSAVNILESRLDIVEASFQQQRQKFVKEQENIRDNLHQLRQQISAGGFACIVEVLTRTLRRAELEATKEGADSLREVRQRLQEPLESSSLAWAYAQLCSIEKDTDNSKRAQRILRDLFVLTTTNGRGPWNNESLEMAMADAFARGCNWPKMENKEMSQLVLAFNKILVLGKSREGFLEKVRSEGMYGPELTDEEVEHLFAAFSACAALSPQYVSKKVATGRAHE